MNTRITSCSLAVAAACVALVPMHASAAPSVSFKKPTSGATLSGSISQSSACEVTGSNIRRVQFYLDSTALNTESSAPWNCNIDTRKFSDGSHTLRAVAYDSAGASRSTSISINIRNNTSSTSSGSTSGLSVAWKQPAEGGALSGNVQGPPNCVVEGTNIARVMFYINGTWTNTDGNLTNGLGCWIDTTKYKDGSYTLKAVAYDASGKSTEASRSVVIKNGTGTTTPTTTTPTTSPTTEPAPAPSTSTGSASKVDAADIIAWGHADLPFSQQSGYTAQVIGTYTAANKIPESGIHSSTLSNGETLRLGKEADPLNSSRKAFSFQLAYSDPNTSGSKRSEFSFPKNIEMNKVYWIAFRVYVRDWGTQSSGGLFGTQLHSGDNSRGLSPSFGFYMSGARNFRVETRYSTASSPSQSNSVTVKHGDHPIPFGRWADIVVKFKHNTSGNGFLQAWVDGTQIVDYKGNLGFNTPGYKDYAKFGLYNWGSFSGARKVMLRSPTVVLDPTGSKYTAAALRAQVQ